jgi:Zn-dependent peptidase ImmA (M78 family)
MLKNRKKEIEDIVDTLMTTTGLEFPKNSATDLAKILGIDYTLADLGDNRNAIIFWDEEFPKIVINDRGSASYQSFFLTKEIGHCVFGHVEK